MTIPMSISNATENSSVTLEYGKGRRSVGSVFRNLTKGLHYLVCLLLVVATLFTGYMLLVGYPRHLVDQTEAYRYSNEYLFDAGRHSTHTYVRTWFPLPACRLPLELVLQPSADR